MCTNDRTKGRKWGWRDLNPRSTDIPGFTRQNSRGSSSRTVIIRALGISAGVSSIWRESLWSQSPCLAWPQPHGCWLMNSGYSGFDSVTEAMRKSTPRYFPRSGDLARCGNGLVELASVVAGEEGRSCPVRTIFEVDIRTMRGPGNCNQLYRRLEGRFSLIIGTVLPEFGYWMANQPALASLLVSHPVGFSPTNSRRASDIPSELISP